MENHFSSIQANVGKVVFFALSHTMNFIYGKMSKDDDNNEWRYFE